MFSGVPSAHRAACAAALTIAALVGATQNSVAAGQLAPNAIAGFTAPGIQLAALGGATQTTMRSVTVKKGGTLEGAIRSAGGSRVEADLAIRALTKLFNPRTLQPGQEIEVRFVTENGAKRLWSVRVKRSNSTGYAAVAEVAGAFFSRKYSPSNDLDILLPGPLDVAQGAIATRSVNVKRGQTLMKVAIQLGANRTEADKAIQALSRLFNPRKLQIGQEVTATFGENMRLLGLSISMGDDEVAALLFDGKDFEPLRTTATQRALFLAEAVAATSPAVAPNQDENGPLVGFDHFAQSLIVSRGDTLIDSAVELGASRAEALAATKALAAIFNARSLKIGQVITATFGRTTPEGAPRLLAFSVAVSANAEAAAFLSESGEYSSRQMTKAESQALVAKLAVPAATLAPRPAPPPPPSFDWVATIDRTVTVHPGDTLMEAVLSVGATPNEAHEAIQALTKIFDPRRLMVGQDIRMTFADEDVGTPNARLLAINVSVDVDREMAAIRSQSGGFAPFEIIKELDRQYTRASGTIDNSLFLAADRAGVPANTLMELIRIYSWDVDFQRDIREGDSFEVFFEMLYDDAGNPVKEGNILYAQLTLSGTTLPLYRYEDADGIIDYYNGDGHSVRKALLRTPVDGARLSSGFGMRRHPIAGYSRMHQGIDFAAPSGTPIKAAGDGVIEVAGRNGGYGNYIRIRHNSEHKTAYAHISKFASGIRVGTRVRQGQTIGYVGSTGASTGPHLHYEVLVNNAQVNPMSLKLPTGRRLEGPELAVFTETRLRVDAEWDRTPDIDLAAAE
jgi:murein DD-endopeptidase MepM/ murein hydrolase activator NlpD